MTLAPMEVATDGVRDICGVEENEPLLSMGITDAAEVAEEDAGVTPAVASWTAAPPAMEGPGGEERRLGSSRGGWRNSDEICLAKERTSLSTPSSSLSAVE
jgi:hypothetical protein